MNTNTLPATAFQKLGKASVTLKDATCRLQWTGIRDGTKNRSASRSRTVAQLVAPTWPESNAQIASCTEFAINRAAGGMLQAVAQMPRSLAVYITRSS